MTQKGGRESGKRREKMRMEKEKEKENWREE